MMLLRVALARFSNIGEEVSLQLVALQPWKSLFELFGAYIQRVALQPFSFLPTNSMCSLQFCKLLLKLFGAYIKWVALRPFSFLSPNSMCSDDVYESDSAHEYCNASHKCHDVAGAKIFRIWHPCIVVI